jgi:undecaprenyl-diphosphatase
MASLIEAVVLGIVQGLTEWLPVSSSGHLVIVKEFISWEPFVLFDVLLHLSTLFVILIFFRRTVMGIAKALLERNLDSAEGRLGVFIIVGSIPTAAIGYVFREIFKSFFSNLMVVGFALMVTGILLFSSDRRLGSKELNLIDSILVGVAQGVALIPGISRSGATISTQLLRGIDRRVAFEFSFLLSVPAVVGGFLLESHDLSLLIANVDVIAVIVGVVVASIVGYFSLRILLKTIIRQRFHLFAFYCWVAGILVIASQII